ncbi:MAG TPA: energy-coupling factor transporter transmembrane component T [Opitutaceae bacterium]|nr:energy-coupling factor transporter transmembrane component T [Opitutaceae bacterium]
MSGIHLGATHGHPHADNLRHERRAESWLERQPAGLKLAVMLTLVLGTAVLPVSWIWWHGAVAGVLVAAMVAGRVNVAKVFLRLVWFAPFVAGAALAASWHGGAGPGWRPVALRGGLCLATAVVFGAVTPLAALPGVLRRAGVPALLVSTLTLMQRYLFVLADEAQRMQRARASRTLVAPRRFAWALPGEVVGRMFVRASERAERIYLAMCARGWR